MKIRGPSPGRALVTPGPNRERVRDVPPRRERRLATPPRRVAATPTDPGRRRLIRRSLRGHVERDFRPDVEGLRAIAVVAVILYHAKVPWISGGFAGVDVFFVVSGFLITRLVLGELSDTGTISLPAFWGRRARRLLPASAVVVVATVLAARQTLSPLSLRDLATDSVAAGTFTANFVFANRLGDYFGAQLGATQPSPLLHFWSLAVEEQFYLCWPPLLLLLARRPRQYRRLLLAVIAAIGAASMLLAGWLTPREPAGAFYLLPSRMGELLVGAGLAVVGAGLVAIPARIRAMLAWAGLAAIAVAFFAIDESIPWPGFAVLVPVLGTAAVIIGGSVGRADGLEWAPGQFLGAPGMRWVGRHSYALYLWHWPVLVLAAARWGPLTWPERIVLIAFAVALSAASVRLVENPVRHSRYLAAVPARSLAIGAAMCAVVVTAGWTLHSAGGELDGGVEAAMPELAPAVSAAGAPITVAAPGSPTTIAAQLAIELPSTVAGATTVAAASPSGDDDAVDTTLATPVPPSGALAQLVASTQRLLANNAGALPVPSNLQPSLGSARERSQPYDDGCVNIGRNSQLQPCEYGVAGANRTILLYGDSKAVQWFEPLEKIAVANGYRLVVLAKGGCPVAAVDVPTPVLHFTCPPYRDAVISWIGREDPDVVVVSNSYTQYPAGAEEWSQGTAETVARLADVSSNVVLIGDNPAFVDDPPACLSANLDDVSECATSRDEAVDRERISAEVVATREHDVRYVDTTDWFCTRSGDGGGSCPAVVGNILVMRDETHITAPMAELMRPLLDAALAPAIR